jgi:Domain of unknown function (DUF4168)
MHFRQSAVGILAALIGTYCMCSPAASAMMMDLETSRTVTYAQNAANGAPVRVDDATLKRAAAAFVKVRDISVKTEQAIHQTDDSAKKEQLIAEGESEKVAAVKAEGMEPQQYNDVLMLVKDDTGLQHKFLSYVGKLRHSS